MPRIHPPDQRAHQFYACTMHNAGITSHLPVWTNNVFHIMTTTFILRQSDRNKSNVTRQLQDHFPNVLWRSNARWVRNPKLLPSFKVWHSEVFFWQNSYCVKSTTLSYELEGILQSNPTPMAETNQAPPNNSTQHHKFIKIYLGLPLNLVQYTSNLLLIIGSFVEYWCNTRVFASPPIFTSLQIFRTAWLAILHSLYFANGIFQAPNFNLISLLFS